MVYEALSPLAVNCTYCGHTHHIYEAAAEDSVRIACPMCHQEFSVNLLTMRASKRVGDNETRLQYKLKCPHGCKHYFMYENKIDNIVGDKCSVCGRYFRGNMLYSQTWPTKPQSFNM